MIARDRQIKLTPREWLLSILLHAIVLGFLIWFTPARGVLASLAKKNLPPPAPSSYQDPAQVREVVKAIAQEQADTARKQVAKLMDLEKKLDQLAKNRLDDYNKQAQTIATDAAQKALDQLKQTPPEQDATMQAQNQLGQQVQTLLSNVTSPTPDPNAAQQTRNQIESLKQTINRNQIKTGEDQAKAIQLMHFLRQDSPVTKTQQKANDAQTAAALSQKTAMDATDKLLSTLSPARGQTSGVNHVKDNVAKDQAEIDTANKDIAQQQPVVDGAKKALDAATAAFNQAHDSASTDTERDNRKIVTDAQTAMRKAEQAYNRAKHLVDRDAHRIKSLTDQLQKQQQRLQQTGDIPAATQARLAQLQTQFQTATDASKTDQASAGQTQMAAINQLTGAAASPAPPPPAAAPPSELETKMETGPSALEGRDLGQLYETAGQVEDRIADKYKVYRAMEFASIQKLTLADALQATQVAKPNREKLDTQLLSAKRSTKNFASYKEEVIKSRQQIESMVDLSSDMVATAEAQKNLGSGDVKLEEDRYDSMVASARDDENAAGKDLTRLTGRVGAPDTAPVSGTPGFQGMGQSDDSSQYTRNAPELPAMDEHHPKGYATRQINANGPHHDDWLYVDSWYLIGPFPNEGRANLNTKFPPESIIDLDAVYPGKNGRSLHWVYTQWNSPGLRPDHDIEDAPAIYYAYTEFMFDQPEDLWVATGSDDKGTMWINNVMVWNSNDILKSWRPNEGYRKVHFTQGRNRILYRIENGQHIAAFSLMISAK